MVWTPLDQSAAEATLVEATADLLSATMGTKAPQIRPQRVQPLAVVLSRKANGTYELAVAAILDIDQRVASIRSVVLKMQAFGFVFIYDGVIHDGQRRDALLTVSGSVWGVWHGAAYPYQHNGLGVTFDPVIDVPDVAYLYQRVFDAVTP